MNNRYTIIHNGTETVLNHEPIGWDGRKRSMRRDTKYHGVFREYTTDFIFVFDGFDTLKAIFDVYGINSEAEFRIEKYNAKDDTYILDCLLSFDFETYQETTEVGKGIKCSLVDNGFTTVLMSRETMELPYDRLETVDGDVIEPFAEKTTVWGDLSFADKDGYNTAKILGIETIAKDVPFEVTDYSYNASGSGEEGKYILLEQRTEFVNPSVRSVTYRTAESVSPSSFGRSDCFFSTAAVGKIKGKISATYDMSSTATIPPTSWRLIEQIIVLTFDPVTGIGVSWELYPPLYERDTTYNSRPTNILFETEYETELQPNQGLLVLISRTVVGALGDHKQNTLKIQKNGYNRFAFDEIYPETYAKTLLPHEAFTRMFEGLTGVPNCFYSDFFGRTDLGYLTDGEGALVGITNGLLLRGFPVGYKKDENEDTTSQLTFTIEKLFQTFDALFCLGLTVEFIEGLPRVRIEPRKYFYNFEIISQPQKSRIKTFMREINIEAFYNEILTGSNVDAYEEVSGINEYNSTTTYSNCIRKINNKYDIQTPYQTNVYGVEYVRRSRFELTKTVDTSYDEQIFLIDLVRNEDGNLIQRTNEGFDLISGLLLISTPMNLNLTPARCIKRHGWWINGLLWQYPTQSVKYSKSTYQTALKTLKSTDVFEVAENADILNSSLEAAQLSGMLLKMDIPITEKIWQSLNINPFGVIAVTDPFRNELVYGNVLEVNSDPVKGEASNITLLEAFPPDVATEYLLVDENNDYFVDENGDYFLIK